MLQEALNSIDQLEVAAEHAPSSSRCFELYECALGICSRHGFKQRAAKIYCKQAEFAVKAGDLNTAMQEADNSIEIYPDHLMVSFTQQIISINTILCMSSKLE